MPLPACVCQWFMIGLRQQARGTTGRGEQVSETKKHQKVGRYVRDVDGEMFREISSHIGSKSLAKVGAYVETCDAEMYDHILEMED